MKGRKTGGRQKGTPNKATAEARSICTAILGDPTYRATLLVRAHAGTLPPAVETMLWHYAYGKPTDIVDVTVGAREENLRELSTEELLERVDTVREQLPEADATERALPAAYRTASRPAVRSRLVEATPNPSRRDQSAVCAAR